MITHDDLDTVIDAQGARIVARFAQVDARFEQLMGASRQGLQRSAGGSTESGPERRAAPRGARRRAGELISALAQQTRQMIVAMIGTVLSLAALARSI